MLQWLKTIVRVALGALAVLMVPLVASRIVEGWHWSAASFVFVYVLFFAVGMTYALIARKMGVWSYKAGVAVALASGFALAWSTLVHVADLGGPVNFVYYSVLVVSHRRCAVAVEGARVGVHVVRYGGDVCSGCRDTAFGRTTRS